MNKKRFLLLLVLIGLVFTLSGCTAPTDANGNVTLIYLDTPFSEMMQEGVFGAILTYPLAQAINYFAQFTNVAIAITLVAILLNAVILLFTFKSNVSMQRMQQMQPELLKIQKKYEGRDDQNSKARMAQEINALYRKYDVNPLGSLLLTFLQLPIMIAMYTAVRRASAVANGTFMGYSLEMTPVEAFKAGAFILLVIYVLMIVTQLLSMAFPLYLQNLHAKEAAEKAHKHFEKAQNPNAMMTYGMVVFIAFIMLSWPVALSLYYCIYSIINIVKTYLIDKLTHK